MADADKNADFKRYAEQAAVLVLKFLSRFVANTLALIVAGLVLGLIGRMYISWEVARAQEAIVRGMENFGKMKIDNPFNDMVIRGAKK
jgi:hypothetical protein